MVGVVYLWWNRITCDGKGRRKRCRRVGKPAMVNGKKIRGWKRDGNRR